MRKIISYLMFAVAATFFSGCIDVNISPIEPQGPTTVNLQLRNADLVATRAITDDNQYHEDLINSVQCFFTVTDTDAVVYATDLLPINAQQTKTLTLEIPAEYLSTLFANNAKKCDVYVVANYGSKITETTVTAVKAKGITLSNAATQDSFVMDGTAEVEINGTALSATVNLYRAAAKIIVKANVKTPITEGGLSWIPNIAGIRMTYNGSVNESKISAAATDAVTTTAVTYEQTTGVFTKDETASTTDHYVGFQTVPFYSFPVSKDANKGEIDMIIPWKMSNTDDVVEYKYQIPVDIALERNHVYLLEVNVEVLGIVDGAELTPSYVVVDWTENPITAGLSRPKYLVVDQNYVVMNNLNNYSVGYASSDAIKVTILSSTINTLYSNRNQEDYDAVYEESVSYDDSYITLNHVLDNTRSDSDKVYDFKENTIVIRVSHANNSSIYEDITFVQRPAMYMTSKVSTGNVMINLNKSSSVGSVWWYNYGGFLSSRNLYTITVSAFDATTSGYIITDPREPSNNQNFTFYEVNSNTGANGSVRTTATDAANDNTLTGYRATVSGSASQNMVAPSFMMASSAGAYNNTQTLHAQTSTKYRCAAYQEDGYPAGRWRLPTPAELQVVGKLCSEGKLESIFYDGLTYASSDGLYTYNSGSFTKSNATVSKSVRCVYDVWYWNDKCANNSQFIWGAEGDIANGAKSNYLVSVE